MGLSLLTTLLEVEDEGRTLQNELENMPINKKLDLILSKKILKKKAVLKKQNMLETNIGVELLTRITYLNGIKNKTNTIYNNKLETLHESIETNLRYKNNISTKMEQHSFETNPSS